jgi:nonsense-mediated mRNA decay protein 3
MFCVECGLEKPFAELRHGVCADCYVKKTTLAKVKDHVDLEVCVHCNSRKRGEIWVPGHGALEPVVEEAVREAIEWAKVVEKARLVVDVQPEDERNFTVKIVASGVAEGVPFETPLATRSRVKNGTCVRCSRIQGGYYEAIVQVRASSRPMELEEKRAIKALASRFIERIVADGDRNAFVLRDEDADRGLDVYMGTTNAARMLAKAISNDYGGKITEHAKTVGQKDGLDLVRMTFAVRLPEYRAGDVVVLKDGLGRVTSIGQKTVQVADLRTGRVRHVERAETERATVLAPKDARDAVVVSQSSGELQLLDPWTYATVSVLRPEGLDVAGGTVRVLRWEGELIVLR